jgi:hypothetical protein
MIETLDLYCSLCINYDDLELINKNIIDSLEQEKIRKIN